MFGRKRKQDDFNAEVEAHIALEADRLKEQGLSDEEARMAARRAFGNVTQAQERFYESGRWVWLDQLLQDLRYGLRQLRRNPSFTVVAILTLALGIGVNTAMFSLLNAILFRPLPYGSPGRLAMLWSESSGRSVHEERSAYWNIEQWRRQDNSFSGLAAFDPASVTLTHGGIAERIDATRVSPDFFRLLGVQPAEGRIFTAMEAEQRERLTVISHRFWQTHFGGSEDALGSTIYVDGAPLQIIGILPPGFRFPHITADVWEPETLSPDWEANRSERGSGSWFVLGRLRPGATFKQAQAEMNTIAQRLNRQRPASEKGLGVKVVPLSLQVSPPRLRLALWMLTGAVFFVLLIAATNVASLLLARGASREREIAIRAALGASRPRIVRQLLAESMTLTFLSGLLGLLVAKAAIRLILILKPADLARLNETGLDLRVLCWAFGLCLITGLLVGLVPAITMARRSAMPSGREGGRGVSAGIGTREIRRHLMVTEFALATILLAGAILLIRSLWLIEDVNPGFRPEQVLSAQLCTPAAMGNAQRVNFYNHSLERIEALPGVESAGIIENFFVNGSPQHTVTLQGNSRAAPEFFRVRRDEVSGGFFKTLGTPLLRGRLFSAADGPDSPRVAIVNDAMARRLWPGRNPVGMKFKLGSRDSQTAWFTVVGVVGNMHRQGLDKEPMAQMFEPLAQEPSRLATLLVRTTRGNPLKMVRDVKAAVHEVNKQVPVYGVATLANRLGAFLGQRRFQTSLLIGFSLVALLMAAVGIFGLIQYSVSTRTHEIGIRMALGAEKGDVLRMIVGQGLKLALIGLAIGISGALALTRFLASLLYGVKPTDPLTFITVSMILIAVALLACYIPARRAAKVDPMVALRYE